MCKTCNGTGGINIEHSWGITFSPCPGSDCDFVSDDIDIERLLAELDDRESMAEENIEHAFNIQMASY